MKAIRIAGMALFLVLILLPILFFNFEPDSVSLIDNRKLAENPFSADGDITTNIENYVNDRIGFRDTLINSYTVLNDKVFGKMVHPSYKYGKDGYVFGAGLTTSNNFGEFHIAFADMIKSIQNYCEERNIPFLFVFNPAKPAIYQEKIADGINYNRDWVDQFLAELDARDINYLDNTKTLSELSATGIEGFNQKFDANHWNYMGAFYGTNKMLEQLKQEIPNVHVNDLSEFKVSEKLETTLLVSNFPINEYVPNIEINTQYGNLNESYGAEIERHPSYRGFGYYYNGKRLEEGAPRALVFQGSYMNSYGRPYMINSFGEYIHVHDYQNVIDFPYYFNIFQPDCVIFEVAEYTISNTYFSYDDMLAVKYNPPLQTLPKDDYFRVDMSSQSVVVEEGNVLTVITWQTDEVYEYVWLESNRVYDMKAVEGGYQVTIATQDVSMPLQIVCTNRI